MLKFLFTRRLWWVAEECSIRDPDCHNCGGGLSHASNVYLSKREALAAAVDFVEQMADGEDAIVQEHDNGHDFMVFTDSREYLALVYSAKI